MFAPHCNSEAYAFQALSALHCDFHCGLKSSIHISSCSLLMGICWPQIVHVADAITMSLRCSVCTASSLPLCSHITVQLNPKLLYPRGPKSLHACTRCCLVPFALTPTGGGRNTIHVSARSLDLEVGGHHQLWVAAFVKIFKSCYMSISLLISFASFLLVYQHPPLRLC